MISITGARTAIDVTEKKSMKKETETVKTFTTPESYTFKLVEIIFCSIQSVNAFIANESA